ncbi:genetic interactor of prohibitins 3, mitochondrial [Monosporozyma unispora]
MLYLIGNGTSIPRRTLLRSVTAFRFINCNSCGVALQNKDTHEKGYYITPKIKQKEDTIQDIKYLLFSQDVQAFHESQNAEIKSVSDDHSKLSHNHNSFICKRCSDLLYQNKYNVKDFNSVSLSKIMEKVPKQSRIMLMAPLNEFPFHINRKLLLDKNYKPTLVLTKSDQLISKKSLLPKVLSHFFQSYFKINMDLKDPFPIIAISTKKKWNISTLLSMMGKESYLIGNANVGKSTLINSLIKSYIGFKIYFDKRGKLIKPKNFDSIIDTDMNSFIKDQEAGVSYVPNMTQSIQPYKISNKIIYDMPGYSDGSVNENIHLESMINKDWLQRIRKTELQSPKRVKKKPYSTFTGTENGSVYTVGGIFYLKAPPNSINKITKYIPGEPKIFRDMDKALQVFQECLQARTISSHPLTKYCGVLPELCNKDKFVRYVIPPFQGSIEVVIKDIGHILLRPTGAYNFTGLYEIWVPRGIEVCIRDPLERTIELLNQHYLQDKTVTSPCPKDLPLISSTYLMPNDEPDPLSKMKSMYIERTSHDLMNQKHINDNALDIVSKLHSTPPKLYWYYKW